MAALPVLNLLGDYSRTPSGAYSVAKGVAGARGSAPWMEGIENGASGQVVNRRSLAVLVSCALYLVHSASLRGGDAGGGVCGGKQVYIEDAA